MLRSVRFLLYALLAVSAPVRAAERERVFDFATLLPGQTPSNTVSTLSGSGAPGLWEIVADEIETAFPSVTGLSGTAARRNVLAQTSRDATDERFPLLILGDELYDDFTFSARVKLVDGKAERMAGLAFRIRDEKNYYVARVSALGNTFRFYKFVDGVRSDPVGPEISIPSGVWHEITVECRANRIRCRLNGKEAIPELTDASAIIPRGRVGLWTKSDSVSYFTDVRISYRQHQTLAETLVAETVARNPRLLGLQMFGRAETGQPVQRLAGHGELGVTNETGRIEADVIEQGTVYFGKVDGKAVVTLPLRNHNGDPIAAVRVVSRSFRGQTEANALAVATPMVKQMQGRARSFRELLE
jgi:hypothetical protein